MVAQNKLFQLRDTLSEIFEQASGIDVNEFDSESTFLEMGMDSLFLTQIAIKIKIGLRPWPDPYLEITLMVSPNAQTRIA